MCYVQVLSPCILLQVHGNLQRTCVDLSVTVLDRGLEKKRSGLQTGRGFVAHGTYVLASRSCCGQHLTLASYKLYMCTCVYKYIIHACICVMGGYSIHNTLNKCTFMLKWYIQTLHQQTQLTYLIFYQIIPVISNQ